MDLKTIVHAHALCIDVIPSDPEVSKCNQSRWPSNCTGFHGHHVMRNSSINMTPPAFPSIPLGAFQKHPIDVVTTLGHQKNFVVLFLRVSLKLILQSFFSFGNALSFTFITQFAFLYHALATSHPYEGPSFSGPLPIPISPLNSVHWWCKGCAKHETLQ